MVVGGKIIPQTTIPIPDWIPEHVFPLLTFVDYGKKEKQIHPPQTPVGTNMAFRKVVFEEIGVFNTDLGRKGNRLLSGEENDFFLRMKAKNLCVWYNPNAIVYHSLDSQRFTKKYIRSRVFWEGVTWSKLIALHERQVPFWKELRYSSLPLVRKALSILKHSFKGNSKQEFLKETEFLYALGKFLGRFMS